MISAFSASLTVPPPPSTPGEQVVFLFLGLETSMEQSNRAILQPILQWGKASSGGGGQFWTIVSAYVAGDVTSRRLEIACYSDRIPVQSGTTVIPEIKLLSTNFNEAISQKTFRYSCGFRDVIGASLVVETEEMLNAIVALEGYRLKNCDYLPNAKIVAFNDIVATSNSGTTTPVWKVVIPGANCNMKTLVRSASCVDILYDGAKREA